MIRLRRLMVLWRRNVITFLIIFSLALQIIAIYKYANVSFDKGKTNDGKMVVSIGNEWSFENLAKTASYNPQSILMNHKDMFGVGKIAMTGYYGGEKKNISGLPALCSQPPSIEQLQQCEGSKYYTPVITPFPVLDTEKMDYTAPPGSPLRAKYGYAIDESDQEDPIITILTPYYNIEPATLNETARSILGQSLQRFQWIIVNDCSTNKSMAKTALDPYRNMNDPRILIIDLEKNQGLPGARKEGLKFAKGKYLLPLDPDDMIEPTYIEKAVWFLETTPNITLVNGYSLGFGYKEYFWEKGFQGGDINLKENLITVATVMRMDILKKIGGYDPLLRTGMEDWDLWMRFADNRHWGHTINEFYFWYRSSPPGKWASIYNETMFAKFMEKQKEKYKVAFSEGVPKVSRPEQIKMESVSEQEIAVKNKLKKCRNRILIILPYMEVGGADQFNLNFAQGLVLDNWEVTIATTIDADNKWLPQFARVTPDIFIMPRFIKATDQARFLVYLIKSRQFDVVMLTNSEMAYRYLSFLRSHAPGPVYVDYTHSDTPDWKNGGYARYSVGAQPLLDRSIFASEYLRKYCIKRGHNENKTASVLIGVDSDRYQPAPEQKSIIRKELGFNQDALLLVYVARLESEKQPEVFAEVLNRVHKAGLDFCAISIGGGKLFDQLNSSIYEYGLQDKVKLLGTIPNTRVQYYVSGSDVVFLPSKVEGISLSIYEGMSMGVMAVSAKVGGQAELVTPDVGYLVVPGTPTEVDEYTDIIKKLAANRQMALDMGRKSREKILNGFSSKDAIRNFKREFCNAAIVSKFTTKLYDNQLMKEMSNEVAVLGFEYERSLNELMPLWGSYQHLVKKCTPPPPPAKDSIVILPSPFKLDPELTEEDLLDKIDIKNLRIVTDVLAEKQIDKKLTIILKDYVDDQVRKNPQTMWGANFSHNGFLHPYNHEVADWNNRIPYAFTHQQYIAELNGAYVGPGSSGTVFDWNRIFLLKSPFNKRDLYEMPLLEEIGNAEVFIHKKLFNPIQVYYTFDAFILEILPKLSLIWDEFESDPTITLLIPNNDFAKVIVEQTLKIPLKRIQYFNPGPGWNPSKVFYAEKLLLPSPTPIGHPIPEQMAGLRDMFYKANHIDRSTKELGNLIVYASRSSTMSPLRRVTNEEELITKIKEFAESNGYEFAIWNGRAEISPEVIQWASKARLLVGVHGSNLAPMVAMRPNATVVEYLFENPWLNWWATSQALSLDYWLIPMKGTSHESQVVTVPIEDTLTTIKMALNKNNNNHNIINNTNNNNNITNVKS